MDEETREPSIHAWVGCTAAIERWLGVFYDAVEADDLLARYSAGR